MGVGADVFFPIKKGRKFSYWNSQYLKRSRKYQYEIKIQKGRKLSQWVFGIHQYIKEGRKTKQLTIYSPIY